MKIMVSACLLGENCKYNGKNNKSDKVLEYIKSHEVIPVCPEVAGGLPIPRIPAEIVDGIVTNKEGLIVDNEFRLGAKLCLEKAIAEDIDLAILKSKSPSCGSKEIYDGSFQGNKISGQGVFAKLLTDAGIRIVDSDDI